MSIDQQYALADALIYFGAFGLLFVAAAAIDAVWQFLARRFS